MGNFIIGFMGYGASIVFAMVTFYGFVKWTKSEDGSAEEKFNLNAMIGSFVLCIITAFITKLILQI